MGKVNRSTPEKQTLILWALLAKDNAAGFQNELKPEPEKADRDALEKAGLIKCERRGRNRRIWIEVTEKGWAWASDHLNDDLPAGSPAGSSILQAWLTRLKAYMQARNVPLAEILGPQDSPQAGAAGGGTAEALTSAPRDYAVIRERVRQAYLDITGGRFNTRALLSDIRGKLKDIDRVTLDGVLKGIHLEEGTTLSGLNNPREITQMIRDAGLNFKGEWMFVLWITK